MAVARLCPRRRQAPQITFLSTLAGVAEVITGLGTGSAVGRRGLEGIRIGCAVSWLTKGFGVWQASHFAAALEFSRVHVLQVHTETAGTTATSPIPFHRLAPQATHTVVEVSFSSVHCGQSHTFGGSGILATESEDAVTPANRRNLASLMAAFLALLDLGV